MLHLIQQYLTISNRVLSFRSYSLTSDPDTTELSCDNLLPSTEHIFSQLSLKKCQLHKRTSQYCFSKMWNCYKNTQIFSVYKLVSFNKSFETTLFLSLHPFASISRNFAPNIGYAYHLWVPATPIGGWRGAEKSTNEWTKYAISTCLPQGVRKECFIISNFC